MPDILASLAIIVAAVTWYISHARDRISSRVSHTADILANLSISERLAESSVEMTRIINSGAKVSFATVDPKTEAHIIDILDYYEFICDLYQGDIIDKTTLVNLRGRLMKLTWEVCEPYITETRVKQKRTVYSGFERFVRNLKLDHVG